MIRYRIRIRVGPGGSCSSRWYGLRRRLVRTARSSIAALPDPAGQGGRTGASRPGASAPARRSAGTSELARRPRRRASRRPGRSAAAPRTSRRRRTTGRAGPAGAPGRRPGARPRARRRAPRCWRTTRVKCSSAARAASSPCERATIHRASASFDSIGSAGRRLAARRRAATSAAAARPGSASSRPNISSGGAVSGMLFPTDELIFSPSQERRSGVVSTTCGSSP